MVRMKASLSVLSIAFLIPCCGNTENNPDLIDSASEKDRIESAVELRNLKETKVFTYILPNTNKPYSGWAKMTWDNGQVVRLYKITDGEVTRFKKWQQNGIPQFDIGFTKGKFRYGYSIAQNHGTQNGLTIFFYQSGQKKSEENYKDGKRDGPQNFWYENGQKLRESRIKDGKLDGLWTSWHKNGQKELEGNYKEGVRNGLWTSWYQNKQKKMEGNLKDGKEQGLVVRWYSSGRKKSAANYEEGKLMSAEVWKRDGKKCPITNLKGGDGVLQYYHFNGQKMSKTNYKGGIREHVVFWNKNGKEISRQTFKDGIQIKP